MSIKKTFLEANALPRLGVDAGLQFCIKGVFKGCVIAVPTKYRRTRREAFSKIQ
jgi:hypothetical protein